MAAPTASTCTRATPATPARARSASNLLSAWRESPLYTPRERAALAWTEALTLVAELGAPDGDCEEARRHFTEQELVELTLLIGAINVWNRINVGFRSIHPVDEKPTPAAANA